MKLFLPFFLLVSAAFAQLTVTSSTADYEQVVGISGSLLTDVLNDQQTGQGSDDFSVNGFFMNYETVNGVLTQFVRFQFNVFDSKGFRGNVRLGVDANYDGDIDLFYGVTVTGGNNNSGIFFQNPGTGLNISPSTTSLLSSYGRVALTSDNYSYTVSDVISDDSMLSFAVSFNSINSALNNLGININEDSYLRYVAFTSTQDNSINQDLYGSTVVNTSIRFDEGVFTEYSNFSGNIPIVPEPQVYGAIFMTLCLILLRFRSVK